MEAGLEGARGLCCTAAAIWYVLAINFLRNIANTQTHTSNVINTFSVDNSLISLQTDLHSEALKAGSSKISSLCAPGLIYTSILYLCWGLAASCSCSWSSSDLAWYSRLTCIHGEGERTRVTSLCGSHYILYRQSTNHIN